ncbi:MAG TPA: apolipoprotein N-acyltransferase [Candidatus Paceibacterota bacterium]
MEYNHKSFAVAGLSGLSLAFAYPGWDFSLISSSTNIFGWIVWVGIVPLLWSLSKATSKKNAFLLGFLSGFFYFLIIFRWFWSLHPLDTLGIENAFLSILIITLTWLISSAGMALFWGIFGFAYSLTKEKIQYRKYNILLIACLFVICEYIRSWGFGLLWWGSGTLWGPHWTMGNLAYALGNNPLILNISSFVGIYGVTFLIIVFNLLVYKIFFNQSRFSKIKITTIIVLLSVTLAPKYIYGVINNSEIDKEKINFAIIQTSQEARLLFTPQEVVANFKEQLELLDQIAKQNPETNLVIFPEASEFFKNISLFLDSSEIQNYFSNLFNKPVLIIAGGRVIDPDDGKAYSRVYSLDTHEGIVNYYDKRLPVPGGEFLPYPIRLLTSIFSLSDTTDFKKTRELYPGKKEVSTVDFRYQISVSPIICSELISPNLTVESSANSDLIFSMASYALFHGNETIANQMLSVTLFRAAETKKPIITAVNLGKSHVIDSNGILVLRTQDSSSQILTGLLSPSSQESWYNKAGNTPAILGSLLLGIFIWFSKKQKR